VQLLYLISILQTCLCFASASSFHFFCRLTGRGTVEFTIEKVDGSTFSPEAGGEPKKNAKIQV
jgi:hypothetical protein